MIIKLEILGIPRPKQSARFRAITGANGKAFVTSYQKKEVKDNEANIAYTVIQQLEKGFQPFDEGVSMYMQYIFPPPAAFNKKKMEQLKTGKIFYNETKPDLTDNLNKGLVDAMAGILYTNDSRVVTMYAEKIYGMTPKTIIWVCASLQGNALYLGYEAKVINQQNPLESC